VVRALAPPDQARALLRSVLPLLRQYAEGTAPGRDAAKLHFMIHRLSATLGSTGTASLLAAYEACRKAGCAGYPALVEALREIGIDFATGASRADGKPLPLQSVEEILQERATKPIPMPVLQVRTGRRRSGWPSSAASSTKRVPSSSKATSPTPAATRRWRRRISKRKCR